MCGRECLHTPALGSKEALLGSGLGNSFWKSVWFTSLTGQDFSHVDSYVPGLAEMEGGHNSLAKHWWWNETVFFFPLEK